MIFYVFLVLLSVSSAFALSGDEAAALAAIGGAIPQTQRLNVTWNINANTNPCLWTGVTCENETVTEVYLADAPLQNSETANLATAISALSNLTRLEMPRMQLSGMVPAGIAGLPKLRVLDLGQNRFVGSLPDTFTNCPDLLFFKMVDNQLTGSLPSSFGNCPNLEEISLGVNGFTGGLPSSWGGLSNLQYLRVPNNQLTGSIPSSWGSLGNLLTLALFHNQLGGPLPASIVGLTRLTSLEIQENSFSGPLPAGLFGVGKPLTNIFIGTNQFSGSIPPEVGLVDNLDAIDISSNKFTGVMPHSIWSHPKNRYVYAQNNADLIITIPQNTTRNLIVVAVQSTKFSGSIPAWIGECPQLEQLTFSFNLGLTGSIPESLGLVKTLREFRAKATNLSGPIPSSLGNCTNLQGFDIGNTSISGILPDSLRNLTAMKYFAMGYTNISGTIPTGFFQGWTDLLEVELYAMPFLSGRLDPSISGSTRLSTLILYETRFSGPLPNFSNFSSLKSLQISGCGFNGTMPPVPGNSLESMEATRNEFTGQLPDFSAHIKLLALDFSRNRLSGTIPLGLENLSVLIRLRLQYNNISGSIPTTLFRYTGISDPSAPDGVRAPMGIGLKELSLQYNNLTGTIPPEIGSMRSTTLIKLNNNQLSGKLPNFADNSFLVVSLRQLDLSHNQLNGTITSGYLNLYHVEKLYLNYNNFEGPFPDIHLALDLRELDMSYNRFSGGMPDPSFLPASIFYMDLSFNQFDSSGFEEFSYYSGVYLLWLEGNPLNSEIPGGLSRMIKLVSLKLNNCGLRGSIPSWIGYLTSLAQFDASRNSLSGSLPQSISTVPFQYLNLSSNSLTGAVPFGLHADYLDLTKNSFTGGCVTNINATGSCDIRTAGVVCSCGSFCLSDHNCSTCTTTSCTAALGLGDTCSDFRECPEGAVCEANICTRPASVGTPNPTPFPVAAVVVPIVIVLVAAAGFAALLIWRKKRKARYVQDTAHWIGLQPLLGDENALRRIPASQLEIMQELGRGANGVVNLALYQGSFVAYKTFADATEKGLQLMSIMEEAEIMQSIRKNRHVVELVGLVEGSGSSVGLLMEFCPRGSLRKHFKRVSGLTEFEVFKFAYGIASGMTALAGSGIVHGDLRADNVLLGNSLLPKVADFGLSRNDNGSSLAKKGSSDDDLGPYKWQAPEVLQDNATSQRSDAWSFGCTLVEILTQKEPYYGYDKSAVDLIVDVRNRGYDPLSHISSSASAAQLPFDSEWILVVLRACFKQNANDRPSFREIRYLLGKLAPEFKRQYEEEIDAQDSLLGNLTESSEAEPMMAATVKPTVSSWNLGNVVERKSKAPKKTVFMASPAAAGQIDLENVEQLGKLGSGSFGAVYLGQSNGVYVALKVITTDGASADEVLKEADLMTKVKRHKNIVQLWGMISKNEQLSIVMEFAAKGSLEAFLKTHQASIGEALLFKWALGIARGMEALASSKIVHRDLAVRNILLDGVLEPKVADFGLSRSVLDPNKESSTKSELGPIRSFAPECFDLKYSEKSDVWAYGTTLIEMTTGGGLPFPAMGLMEVALAVRDEGRTPAEVLKDTDGPAWLLKMIRRCCSPKASDRPAFSEIVAELEAVGPTIQAIREAEAEIQKRRDKRAGEDK